MKLLLGLLASRPILILVFYLIVLPAGLLMRAAGRDPMARKQDPSAASYRSLSDRRHAGHMEND